MLELLANVDAAEVFRKMLLVYLVDVIKRNAVVACRAAIDLVPVVHVHVPSAVALHESREQVYCLRSYVPWPLFLRVEYCVAVVPQLGGNDGGAGNGDPFLLQFELRTISVLIGALMTRAKSRLPSKRSNLVYMK